MDFKTFLLEGRGINNELKEYINEIRLLFFKEIFSIQKDYLNNKYTSTLLTIDNNQYVCKMIKKKFDFNLTYQNKQLKISDIIFDCTIYIGENLESLNVKNNKFSIQDTDIIIDNNEDVIIKPLVYLNIFINEPFLLTKQWGSNGFMSSILHELHHIFQFWLMITKDEDYSLSMIKAVNISHWYNKKYIDGDKNIYDLYYRLYLSRPHEVTARTAQLYEILSNCVNLSLDSLIDSVKISNEWKLSYYIENFNKDEFLINLQSEYSNSDIINILSELFEVLNTKDFINDDLNINYKILDINVIKSWLNKCEKHFKSLGKKIRNKLLKIAKEVYIDNNKLSIYEKNSYIIHLN
jgi:hypothetical protein